MRVLARTSQNVTSHDTPMSSVNACAALAEVLQRTGCSGESGAIATTEDSSVLHVQLRSRASGTD